MKKPKKREDDVTVKTKELNEVNEKPRRMKMK